MDAGFPDVRELGPLQLAYLGDTLHDLYVRSRLVATHAPVGRMHRRASAMVCARTQAAILEALADDLTPEEADAARRGRNAQARHAAPRSASAEEYAKATALETLWGYLYITGQEARMRALMDAGFARTEELWEGQR